MILDIVKSKDGVPIRLTEERWFDHILEEHPYMNKFYNEVLLTIENPEMILRGYRGSKIAVMNLGKKRWLHIIYRELNREDGFIISAYIKESFNSNLIIWQSDK